MISRPVQRLAGIALAFCLLAGGTGAMAQQQDAFVLSPFFAAILFAGTVCVTTWPLARWNSSVRWFHV